MREILFRGKREKDGEWIFGYYCDDKAHGTDFPCIIPLRDTQNYIDWAVIPETVGQWTGVKDEDGDKIFKGHIVVYKYISDTKYVVTEQRGVFMLMRLDGETINYDDLPQNTFPIGSNEMEFMGYRNDYCVSFFELMENEQDFEGCLSCEIVGNIHDNPELLKEDAE